MELNNNNQFKLIDGNFKPKEAMSALLMLLNSKINYHSLEAFSIKERFKGDVSHSEIRIEELKNTKTEIEALLNKANELGMNLKITSNIIITMETPNV